MRTYVILQNNIDGMGVGQMYVCNKAKYRENLGRTVVTFSSTDGQVMIPELIISPLVYSRKFASKIIDRLRSFIVHQEYCIIESGSARMVFWGELLAQRLQFAL